VCETFPLAYLAYRLLDRQCGMPDFPSLDRREEVAAMGGPWRERGFDPAEQRSTRPWSKKPVNVAAQRPAESGLSKVVLAYIAAVAMSFGLMLSLLHRGW
jgi:hypothetical protein